MKTLPIRPTEKEEVYAENDADFGWCVFGINSGFCYSQPSTQEEAERVANEMNRRIAV